VSERSSVGSLLQDEFGDVLIVGRRVPRPSVARTPVHWAILAGAGAGFFASAFVTVALAIVYSAPRTSEVQLPTVPQIAQGVEIAVALAVAWRAGGWIAAEGYGAIIALERLVAIPSVVRFCETIRGGPLGVTPASTSCTLEGQIARLVPIVVGVVAAVVVARFLGRTAAATNGVLEAAGALALAETAWFTILRSALSPSTPGAPGDPVTAVAFGLGQALVGGIFAGLVLGGRAQRRWWGYAAVMAAALAPTLFFSLPNLGESIAYAGETSLGLPIVLSYLAPFAVLAGGAAALLVRQRRAVP
jgi:hypothetical protein